MLNFRHFQATVNLQSKKLKNVFRSKVICCQYLNNFPKKITCFYCKIHPRDLTNLNKRNVLYPCIFYIENYQWWATTECNMLWQKVRSWLSNLACDLFCFWLVWDKGLWILQMLAFIYFQCISWHQTLHPPYYLPSDYAYNTAWQNNFYFSLHKQQQVSPTAFFSLNSNMLLIFFSTRKGF